jgi:sigma-B regulation protein RsbU (phosphoserine phosphatase)
MLSAMASFADDILVVDDTPANLRLLSQMLSGQGYRVRAVTSGARALESARAAPPSLILLDVRMPEMSGYDVCERLKSDERTHDVPVIFISALDDLQDKVHAFKAGGVDYITKPFQLDEVLVRVETHLALRRLQAQLQEINRRFESELALAGQIQASFLPRALPALPGWALAARLAPARETSGDFYDVISLPGGLIGLLVADVVDHGVGAAMFMALSSSLLRTYAVEHPGDPGRAFAEVNRRILADTDAGQFVTVFLGILDPASGALKYANAGQCPPLLMRGEDAEPARLIRTGPPLGAFEEGSWQQQTVTLQPGDLLALYTDGVTEAEAEEGTEDFFGEERLLATLRSARDRGAQAVVEAILVDVTAFACCEHPADDIALVALKRDQAD